MLMMMMMLMMTTAMMMMMIHNFFKRTCTRLAPQNKQGSLNPEELIREGHDETNTQKTTEQSPPREELTSSRWLHRGSRESRGSSKATYSQQVGGARGTPPGPVFTRTSRGTAVGDHCGCRGTQYLAHDQPQLSKWFLGGLSMCLRASYTIEVHLLLRSS